MLLKINLISCWTQRKIERAYWVLSFDVTSAFLENQHSNFHICTEYKSVVPVESMRYNSTRRATLFFLLVSFFQSTFNCWFFTDLSDSKSPQITWTLLSILADLKSSFDLQFFLSLWFICQRFFCVYFKNDAGYFTRVTAQVFILLMRFLL